MPPALLPDPRVPATPADPPDAAHAAARAAAMADVRAAQAGDADAFGRLYHRHVGRLHALALRLTADRTRAEELVQDAFVRAWEQLRGFRGDSSFGTWLHRVAVNCFLGATRRAQRRWAHEEAAGELPEAPMDREGEGLGREGRMDLERAIARLPEGPRTAFVLHELEGYSHDEIAAMQGVAAATIRVQLFRARKRLLEVLEP